MTREDKYLIGCLYAVNRLMEKGSFAFSVKVDGRLETITWAEIKEWIEKQYGISAER